MLLEECGIKNAISSNGYEHKRQSYYLTSLWENTGLVEVSELVVTATHRILS